jgi:hypothetical protein
MSLPTWEQLRESHMMVVDHQTLLVGVYPTEVSAVAVASQRPDDEQMHVFTLCLDEIPAFMQRLQSAAQFVQQEQQSKQEAAAALMAIDLVDRAKGRA